MTFSALFRVVQNMIHLFRTNEGRVKNRTNAKIIEYLTKWNDGRNPKPDDQLVLERVITLRNADDKNRTLNRSCLNLNH